MFCSKCGQQNDSSSDAFCSTCGNPLSPAAPPTESAMREPMQQPAMQPPMQQPVQINSRPYKAEVVLSLIGSIIGAIVFLILMGVGIEELNWSYDGELIIACGIFSLASFVLGFIGMAQLSKAKPVGGIMLTIGGGLGFIGMFFSYVGAITLLFYPLILAGGITALARRKFVEKNYPNI